MHPGSLGGGTVMRWLAVAGLIVAMLRLAHDVMTV
jgi:acyl-CoA hydrolase